MKGYGAMSTSNYAYGGAGGQLLMQSSLQQQGQQKPAAALLPQAHKPGHPSLEPHQVPGKLLSAASNAIKTARGRPVLKVVQLLPVLFVPWIIFLIVSQLRGFWLRYMFPEVSLGFSCFFLLFAGLFVFLAYAAEKDPKVGDSRAYFAVFILSVAAWMAAFSVGDYIYKNFSEEFYQLGALNTYPNVNPSTAQGGQLMDAGIVIFNPKAQLNISMSVGFKDDTVYCVAPIVMPNSDGGERHVDFWAVGLDCCSGHTTDFRCGEYNNPNAHSGVRLLRDDQRAFFRLAVKEAEAMYNLATSNPIFVHYVQNAEAVVADFETQGWTTFLVGTIVSFAVLLFLTASLALATGM
jgi:hypothetical protein